MLCDCFREVEVFREAMQTKKFETCEIPEHTLNTMIMSERVWKLTFLCFLKPYPTKLQLSTEIWKVENQLLSSLTSSPGFTSRCTRPPDNARGRASSRSPGKNGLILSDSWCFSRGFFHQQILSRYNLTVVNSFANLYLEVKISWYQIWKITQMVSRTAPADMTCLQNLLAKVRSDELQSMS